MPAIARRPINISSLDDPRLDVFRDVRDRDLRARDDLFMAESEFVLRRLLRTPDRLHSVLLSRRMHEHLAEALRVLPDDVAVFVTDTDVLARIAGFHVHRGVLAAGRRPRREELTIDAALGEALSRPTTRLVLAEGITNVDNMGGLFRNAAAFGVDGVVLDPTCCDPLYRKSVRVSMGHVLAVPYAVSEDWPGDLERIRREWGVTLVGAEASDKARPLWEIPRAGKCGVLFGSESTGLSAAALGACDIVCRIPMTPGVPSINVATSAAVVLYELARCGSDKSRA